jgi:nicotinamidase-related amidase
MKKAVDNYIQPDLDSAALITIDTQCDTLDGQPLEIPGTSAILPNMKLLLDAFRSRLKPIVHIVRIYKKDGSNVDICRRTAVESGQQILIEDSKGCQIAADLFSTSNVNLDPSLLLSGGIQHLSDSEVIIYKSRWGAFYKTPLENHLKRSGISTLAFIGCNFPNCPRTSIYEASERDYRIILVTDAISGLYEQGKEEMINIGVNLLKTGTLLKKLKPAAL